MLCTAARHPRSMLLWFISLATGVSVLLAKETGPFSAAVQLTVLTSMRLPLLSPPPLDCSIAAQGQ